MANPIYTKNYILRTSDFDMNDRIHPWSVLDLFQDIASIHAELIGIGRSCFITKGIVWVLTRTKYIIDKMPLQHSEVKVTTWPLTPRKLICQRDYVIESMDGETLVRGTSDWVLLDLESRKMVTGEDMYPYDESEPVRRSIDGKLKKIRDFAAEGEGEVVMPGFSDIDVNGHVNNAKYAIYVENVLGGAQVKSMQLDYLHEVRCGEKLTLFRKEDGDEVILKGVGEDGERKFSARVELC